MIAIIDYEAGNTKSVEKACAALGEEAVLTRDAAQILGADKAILPGVGAFGSAMERLNEQALTSVILEFAKSGKPFLGICLGLQLLFEESEESPGVEGLGLLPGRIVRIPATDGLAVPHMGWNSLAFPRESRLFSNIPEQSFVYFVHSYYLKAEREEDVCARCDYGVRIDAAVERDNVFATQFHPEKSGQVGLAILKNFLAL